MLILNVPRSNMTPETEGVNHYNIYSRSRTDLGQFLSHFAYHPMQTVDGAFDSMEGYWYWLKYHDDNLRLLSGYEAKQYGEELSRIRVPQLSPGSDEFKRNILAATSQKLLTMPPLLKFRLAQTRLPLVHAYVHQGKYSFQNSMDFIIEHIIRFRLQGHLK